MVANLNYRRGNGINRKSNDTNNNSTVLGKLFGIGYEDLFMDQSIIMQAKKEFL